GGRDALLRRRHRVPQLRTPGPARRVIRRRADHARDSAGVPRRRLRRPALLGAHVPARAAAHRGAAADPAGPAVAADVARAPPRGTDAGGTDLGPGAVDGAAARFGASATGL